MGTKKPDSVVTSHGNCEIGHTQSVCCLDRSGRHEVNGNFDRIFKKYARSKSWFEVGNAITYSFADVDWENFYYAAGYKYELYYKVSGFSETSVEKPDGTTASTVSGNGEITVTLRCKASVHNSPSSLTDATPNLFTEVTDEKIDQVFPRWKAAIKSHWTDQSYTVELGAPDCPGTFPMSFVVERADDDVYHHTEFTVLDQTHPRDNATWAPILRDPSHAKYATALALSVEWRSNAGKFNLGDSRGTLVFAHEYGHWMGWGDEYIEGRNSSMPHPDDATKSVRFENRRGTNKSLRVAVKIKNPTKKYQDAKGSDEEIIDITVAAKSNWLMSSMQSPQTYPKRTVFTIVDDFVRLYNGDHYDGSNSVYCVDVT